MVTNIPFLLLGDGPAEPTGLGRIARDLAGLLLAGDLPLDLVQVGGSTPPVWSQWRHVPLDRGEDWGARAVQGIYRSIWGERPGVLCAVWDPARLFAYTQIELPVQRWAYTAVDGANVHGRVSGPAAVALQQFDRVLAYNRYGAQVIKATTGKETAWIPHGLELQTFAQDWDPAWALQTLGPHAIGKTVIGSVMTNQPRKDFGLLFHALGILKERGHKIYLWLHTDEMIKAWAVQQLVEDFDLARLVTVTGVGGEVYSDAQLAALYQACQVVVLPTLGEGFGYPIVESLASGVPVVHSRCAGGEGYVPRAEWKVPVRGTRLDSVYAIVRPVMDPVDWANAIERALLWRQQEDPLVVKGYCRGAVSHLGWPQLRSKWINWVKAGLS